MMSVRIRFDNTQPFKSVEKDGFARFFPDDFQTLDI